MKKTLIIGLIMLLCAGFVFAQGAEEAQQATTTETRALQFAYTSLPGSDTDKGCKAMAEKLAELSGGTLTIDCYPGGELYDQSGQATAIRRGTIDITLFGFEWLSGIYPQLGSLCSAYSIVDLEHLEKIFAEDSATFKTIKGYMDEIGIVPISTWYFGCRTLNLRGGENITTPQQMSNVKLRMSNSAGFIAMGKALGAVPTPMNLSEVYMALKNGTIDGQDNPLSTMINRKFYEVTDTVILTNHYVSPLNIYVAKDTWNSLTEEQQGWLKEAAAYGKQVNNESIIAAEDSAVAFLKEQGLTVTEVDVNVWKEFAYAYYANDPISQEWDQELYEQVKALAD